MDRTENQQNTQKKTQKATTKTPGPESGRAGGAALGDVFGKPTWRGSTCSSEQQLGMQTKADGQHRAGWVHARNNFLMLSQNLIVEISARGTCQNDQLKPLINKSVKHTRLINMLVSARGRDQLAHFYFAAYRCQPLRIRPAQEEVVVANATCARISSTADPRSWHLHENDVRHRNSPRAR